MLIPVGGKTIYPLFEKKTEVTTPVAPSESLHSEYTGIEKYLAAKKLKAEDLKPLMGKTLDSIPMLKLLNMVLLDEDVQKYLDNGKLSIKFVIDNLAQFKFQPQSKPFDSLNPITILSSPLIQKYIDTESLPDIHVALKFNQTDMDQLRVLDRQMRIYEAAQQRIEALALAQIQGHRLYANAMQQSRL